MIKFDNFKGMDNRNRADSLPEGFLRNLVNVDVNDMGKLSLRDGSKIIYAGNVHSLFEDYFMEGGSLKVLNADNTATTLSTGFGDEYMFFTRIADTVYFSNGVANAKMKGNIVSSWGVDRPPIQPEAQAVGNGNSFAGEYLYAITWIDENGEESGTPQAGSIKISDGNGIQLTKFVTPPTNIKNIAIYVSQANSETLYLYGEYDRSVSNITLKKHQSDIPLLTQFGNKPPVSDVICSHNGKIYLASGSDVVFTDTNNYGLIMPNNFLRFDSEIKIIASVPSALYVVTEKKTYRITNIDLEGFPIREELKPYGGVKGSKSYDKESNTVFWMTSKGLVSVNDEGIQELSFANYSTGLFTKGATAVIEVEGVKKLVGSFNAGNPSRLIDKKFSIEEINRKGSSI